PSSRPPQSSDQSPEERLRGSVVGVALADRRRDDPDEQLTNARLRPFDLVEAQNLGRSVSILDYRPHRRDLVRESYVGSASDLLAIELVLGRCPALGAPHERVPNDLSEEHRTSVGVAGRCFAEDW